MFLLKLLPWPGRLLRGLCTGSSLRAQPPPKAFPGHPCLVPTGLGPGQCLWLSPGPRLWATVTLGGWSPLSSCCHQASVPSDCGCCAPRGCRQLPASLLGQDSRPSACPQPGASTLAVRGRSWGIAKVLEHPCFWARRSSARKGTSLAGGRCIRQVDPIDQAGLKCTCFMCLHICCRCRPPVRHRDPK